MARRIGDRLGLALAAGLGLLVIGYLALFHQPTPRENPRLRINRIVAKDLARTDPEGDAQRAWQQNDRRFVALWVDGHTDTNLDNAELVIQRCRARGDTGVGLNTILRMSDVREGEEEEIQLSTKQQYARRYNQEILRRLQEDYGDVISPESFVAPERLRHLPPAVAYLVLHVKTGDNLEVISEITDRGPSSSPAAQEVRRQLESSRDATDGPRWPHEIREEDQFMIFRWDEDRVLVLQFRDDRLLDFDGTQCEKYLFPCRRMPDAAGGLSELFGGPPAEF